MDEAADPLTGTITSGLILSVEDTRLLESFCEQHRMDPLIFLVSAAFILKSRYEYEPENITVRLRLLNPVSEDRGRSCKVSVNCPCPETLFDIYRKIVLLSKVKELLGNLEFRIRPVSLKLDFSEEGLAERRFEMVINTGDVLSFLFSCEPDSFYKVVIPGSHLHYRELIHSILSMPVGVVTDHTVLDPAEEQVISKWSEGTYDPEPDLPQCLHEIFEDTATRSSVKPAVYFRNEIVTYAEMNERANRLARYLRSKHVITGDYVAILLPRSPDVYISMLAILKAGAAYVPVDPDYPEDRISFILKDSNAKLLITFRDFRNEFRKFPCSSIYLD